MVPITKEQKKLVEENHNLIFSFLQKYHLAIEEYYGLAAIGLCKACKTYNGDKSNFSTYAYRCMFTTVMCELRKSKQAKRIPEYQIVYYQAEIKDSDGGDTASIINYIPSKENIEDAVLSEIMFNAYTNKLKDRDKKILALFREGYKQIEIAKLLGCSQSYVSRVKRKLCKYLTSG